MLVAEGCVPAFLVGPNYSDVRRRAFKYIRASIRKGEWLPDQEMLRPVQVGSLDGVCIDTTGGYHQPERKNVFFASTLLGDERLTNLLYEIAKERGFDTIWVLYPALRGMLDLVAGEFWAAFALTVFPAKDMDLLPQDSARWGALMLRKILPWVGKMQQLESMMFRGTDIGDSSVIKSVGRLPAWLLGARSSLIDVQTRFSHDFDFRQQKVDEMRRMNLAEFILFAQQEIKPLLPPDGRWVEPTEYAASGDPRFY